MRDLAVSMCRHPPTRMESANCGQACRASDGSFFIDREAVLHTFNVSGSKIIATERTSERGTRRRHWRWGTATGQSLMTKYSDPVKRDICSRGRSLSRWRRAPLQQMAATVLCHRHGGGGTNTNAIKKVTLPEFCQAPLTRPASRDTPPLKGRGPKTVNLSPLAPLGVRGFVNFISAFALVPESSPSKPSPEAVISKID